MFINHWLELSTHYILHVNFFHSLPKTVKVLHFLYQLSSHFESWVEKSFSHSRICPQTEMPWKIVWRLWWRTCLGRGRSWGWQWTCLRCSSYTPSPRCPASWGWRPPRARPRCWTGARSRGTAAPGPGTPPATANQRSVLSLHQWEYSISFHLLQMITGKRVGHGDYVAEAGDQNPVEI